MSMGTLVATLSIVSGILVAAGIALLYLAFTSKKKSTEGSQSQSQTPVTPKETK